MRGLVLVVLAACGSSPDEAMMCPKAPQSDLRHSPSTILAGDQLAGIVWLREGFASREVHAQLVTPDGTIGPDIALTNPLPSGDVGTTSAVWTGGNSCNVRVPFEVVLQRGGRVDFFDIEQLASSKVVVFDGERYQLFWTADSILRHRTLDEDGALGPVHELEQVGTGCVSAASDRAGTTFVRAGRDGYIVDGATGDKRLVFIGPDVGQRTAFFFAGAFHLFGGGSLLLSFPPTSTGSYTTRSLTQAPSAQRFYPAGASLFVQTANGVVELDMNLASRHFYGTAPAVGVLGGNLVRFIEVVLDPVARTPGRIDLARETATEVVWRREVAVDSPVEDSDACDVRE